MSFTPQTLYSAQPRIEDVRVSIAPTEQMFSDTFTFILPHKHYDLRPDEVIWMEKDDVHYTTRVQLFSSLPATALPCMWIRGVGRWVPIAYTQGEDGLSGKPDAPFVSGCNIGLKWLNNGGTEHTTRNTRMQVTLPRQEQDEGIKTMYTKGSESLECTLGLCVVDQNNHCAGF